MELLLLQDTDSRSNKECVADFRKAVMVLAPSTQQSTIRGQPIVFPKRHHVLFIINGICRHGGIHILATERS
jgi:hypothetical protein